MKKTLAVFLVSLSALFVSCSGGGSDSDDGLSTNACGDLGLGTRSHQRIVNGTSCSNLGSSPVVRLLFRTSQGSGFCSGTMITGNDVLTAAHCFFGNPSSITMITGDALESARQIPASDWSTHPNFRETSSGVFDDVAVVHLSQDAGLPTLPVMVSQRVSEGEVVSIFGYGTDENGAFDFQDLESGEMRVSGVNNETIAARFDGEGSNTCTGDSGGPVTSERLGFVAVAGLTSTGTQVNCLEGDTTFFTNMFSSSVRSFLESVVPDAAFR